MTSLIYSRRADNGILTTEDIAMKAPAVFSNTKAERLSDSYAALHTSDLIPVMRDYGYVVTQAAQKRSRKSVTGVNDTMHKAHLIAFTKADDVYSNDKLRPEIVLYNSHDGTSSVKLFAGLYRFVCSNGIVAGEGFNAKVNHTTSAMRGFEDMLTNIIGQMPKLLDTIEALRSRRLDADQMHTLATQAVKTRWDIIDRVDENTTKGVYATEQTVVQALGVRRYEDNTTDAFTVWNRLQKNILRGHLFVKSVTNVDGYVSVKDRKARAVSSVSEHVRINRNLFDLMEIV